MPVFSQFLLFSRTSNRTKFVSFTFLFLYAAAVSSGLNAMANVTLPHVLADHMVLQRDKPVSIWGKATPAEEITVEIDNQKHSAKANNRGDWKVELKPLKIGTPRQLKIRGKNTIVLNDIQVGDVWLCSGQSNMLAPLIHSDAKAEDTSDVEKTKIRMFYVHGVLSHKGVASQPGLWRVIDKASLKSLSTPAIPYLFARGMQKTTGVPNAIIMVACGGAPLETFFPPATVKQLRRPPPTVFPPFKVGCNYSRYLEPVTKLSIRGVLWYQGETNFVDAGEYGRLFPIFISDWRKHMDDHLTPFYFVQMPNHGLRMDKPGDALWADLREAQSKALNLPKVHMVVSVDTVAENPAKLHVKEKREIARRLVEIVKATDFDSGKDPGAVDLKQTIDGQQIKVTVKTALKQLTAPAGNKIKGFQIAGADRVFQWADAKIKGKTITLANDKVKSPRAVRYAWADNPECNVFIGDLPLPPFRTDRWPSHAKLNDEDWPKK